jgi:ADP-heptose:LPS heptosyltransferase
MQESILAIRLRRLGDVLAARPALVSLKRGYPGRKLIFMIDGCYHELLRGDCAIDELIAPPPRLRSVHDLAAFAAYVDGLRRKGIGIAVDFHSNPRSAVISYLSGAARRIGYDVRIRKVFYTEVEPRSRYRRGRRLACNSSESAVDLAVRAGGVPVEGPPPLLEVDPASATRMRAVLREIGAGEDAIGINPGDPYPAKAWPEDYFVEIARRLASSGRAVVVMWGPGEEERAERIKERAGEGVFLSPPLGLAELPGFLSNLSLLVTIDSGLKHLAVAVGLRTLTVFGPTSPDEWHVGRNHDRILSLHLSCSPCRLLACPFGSPCMAGITPASVMEQVEDMLGGREAPVTHHGS